jgi:uncharacterized protein YcbK (DUF882 family)
MLVAAWAGPSRASRKPRSPSVELVALNTHESFRLQPDAAGHLGAKQLHGWNRFLRCHHTGRVHAMATRLAALLYDTSRHFSFARVLVVAGYRAPRIAREKGNPKSPHKKGLACDFRVEGVPNTSLRDYLRAAFHHVGVGFYPNSDFVHLDVERKKDGFWIDYSGPGERARYSSDPDLDLRSEGPGPQDDDDSGAEPPSLTAPAPPTP